MNKARLYHVILPAVAVVCLSCGGGKTSASGPTPGFPAELIDPGQLPVSQTKDGARCTLTSAVWLRDEHPEKSGECTLDFTWEVTGVRASADPPYRWCVRNVNLFDEGGSPIRGRGHWFYSNHYVRRGDDPKRPWAELRIACRRADSPPPEAYRSEEHLRIGQVDVAQPLETVWVQRARTESSVGTVGVRSASWVRREDLPGGKQVPSLELVCYVRADAPAAARSSLALKPGDVSDDQGRDLVPHLVASAPAGAFQSHYAYPNAYAWVFYFQPGEPLSKKLDVSIRLRSGLDEPHAKEYFRDFAFQVQMPKPPAPLPTTVPLASQTKDDVTLTVEDCARPHPGAPKMYMVWTTAKGPLREGEAVEVGDVTAWDSNGRPLRRLPGSPLMTDPRHLLWKCNGSIPADDEVAQKFFFDVRDGPPQWLKLQFQCSGNGPTFVFDRVPVRIR
ncbi:MAG: hypothetical protein ACYTG0_16255 [Planctomycetota bacterium]